MSNTTEIEKLTFYGWSKDGMKENPDIPIEDAFILRSEAIAVLQNKVSDISAEGIAEKYIGGKYWESWDIWKKDAVLKSMKEYASIVNERKESAGSWVNVEDRLPLCYQTGNWDGKRSDFVLMSDKNDMQIVARVYSGFLDGSTFTSWYNQDDYEVEFATHWMPLPAPPESQPKESK